MFFRKPRILNLNPVFLYQLSFVILQIWSTKKTHILPNTITMKVFCLLLSLLSCRRRWMKRKTDTSRVVQFVTSEILFYCKQSNEYKYFCFVMIVATRLYDWLRPTHIQFKNVLGFNLIPTKKKNKWQVATEKVLLLPIK